MGAQGASPGGREEWGWDARARRREAQAQVELGGGGAGRRWGDQGLGCVVFAFAQFEWCSHGPLSFLLFRAQISVMFAQSVPARRDLKHSEAGWASIDLCVRIGILGVANVGEGFAFRGPGPSPGPKAHGRLAWAQWEGPF